MDVGKHERQSHNVTYNTSKISKGTVL